VKSSEPTSSNRGREFSFNATRDRFIAIDSLGKDLEIRPDESTGRRRRLVVLAAKKLGGQFDDERGTITGFLR
jgi:hypothetical protein